MNLPNDLDFEAASPYFYSYSDYLKKTFGGKTFKVVVSSGLSCPTRDGTIDKGGCAFCDVRGSSSFYGKVGRGKEIATQIDAKIPGLRKRFPAQKLIAYFQSYTNTYSDLNYLREIYTAALCHTEIAGLAIGTRPDCIPDAVLDLLEELAQKSFICLELGVQSFDDASLSWLTRGHDAQCSREAMQRIKARAPSIQTCLHLMFGAPNETREIARQSAQEINALKPHGVKLHQLMVLKNTKLAERYQAEPFRTLSETEYAEIVGDFLLALDPEIYVERLMALATHPEELIAPEWSKHRWQPQNSIREYFQKNNIRQGKNFSANDTSCLAERRGAPARDSRVPNVPA